MKPDRKAFLEARRSGIGGSDWASILRIPGAYSTPLEVWRSKVEPVADDDEQTYAQARGDALEPFVCEWFGRETGLDVLRGVSEVFSLNQWASPMPRWWRCQIDALVAAEGDAIVPLEAKTATSFKRDEWGESGTDQVPLRYVVQVMAQIAYLNAPYGYLAVDIGGDQFRWYKIQRDEELIAHMLKEGEKFWRLAQDGIPPEPSTSAEANLVWKHHEPGEYLQADGQIRALCRAINEHKREEKANATLREKLELELKKALQDREGAKDGDKVLATWKTQSSERIDTKALRAKAPKIAAQFVKVSETRVLRVKEDGSDE